MNLVIVESPTKAKTISKFLGGDFDVDSSYGHIRDLPKTTMGVNIDTDFEPRYRVPKQSQKHVLRLKKKVKKAQIIYLATDEDREGEAIAWHLLHALGLENADNVKRLVFHEITKEALLDAIKHPRTINQHLVDAQQGRRILDRLVGYTLSPLLWRKVARGLSAGRVQSVAVRLIVDREREIEAFKPDEYWSITAHVAPKESGEQFKVELKEQNEKKLDTLAIKSEQEAKAIIDDLENADWKVMSVESKTTQRHPSAPYTTSSLQQDAAQRLGFSAARTMRAAQRLYETGHITYMRTDSVAVAASALNESRSYIKKIYGNDYLEQNVRRFKTKQKRAQEAHEAIRPTKAERTPDDLSVDDNDQQRLYKLIWSRFLASQMSSAQLLRTVARIPVRGNKNSYTFVARGQTMAFEGFTKVYPVKTKEESIPALHKNDNLRLINLIPEQHVTQPPPRYNDASLIKALEEHGIGRPSTYAPIISTIQHRGYITNEKRRFYPTAIGKVVNDLLVKHFPSVVDIDFTATMENDLDDIASGNKQWKPLVKEFYKPFAERVKEKDKELKKEEIAVEETDEICEECKKPMVIRLGRYGKFLACTGFPKCRNTRALEEHKQEDGEDYGTCPKCDGTMIKRSGRFGAFLGCQNYPACKHTEKIKKNEETKNDEEE